MMPVRRPACHWAGPVALAFESILVRYSSRLSGARPSSQAATPGRLGSSWGITATKTRSSFSRTARGQSLGIRVATPYFGASNGSVGGRSMAGSAGMAKTKESNKPRLMKHPPDDRRRPGSTWNWLVVPGDSVQPSFLRPSPSRMPSLASSVLSGDSAPTVSHGREGFMERHPRKSGHRCTECRFQLTEGMADDSSGRPVECLARHAALALDGAQAVQAAVRSRPGELHSGYRIPIRDPTLTRGTGNHPGLPTRLPLQHRLGVFPGPHPGVVSPRASFRPDRRPHRVGIAPSSLRTP